MKRNLLVLPKSLRNRALNLAHQGHLGLSKTKALIREKTWFPYIDTLTEELITSCLPCQLVGLPKPPAPLQPTQLPPKPWHTVNMDFLGPLPSGEMLLVVIDQYSRFPEVELLRSTAASATIHKLDSIFARHGYPVKVRTDNGPPWNSTEIDNYMHRNGIQFKPCTPLHPKGNSEAEVFMKPLQKAILTAHADNQNWRKELHSFLLNYRASPHSTTKIPPAEALYNRPIRTKLPEPITKPLNSVQHKKLKAADEKVKRKMKEYHDKRTKAKERTFNIGDTVLVKQQKKNKLSTRFNPNIYTVKHVKGTMITATSGTHSITRNVSFFKHFNAKEHKNTDFSDDEDDYKVKQNCDQVIVNRRYPLRNRELPQRYVDPSSCIITHG